MPIENLSLYEALNDRLGQETAAMLSEAVHDRTDLVTKADLKAEMAILKADLKAEMAEMFGKLSFRMLACFIPLWIAMCGMVGAFIFRR